MHALDPEQEQRRLADVYSHATEEELRRLADQAYSLTDAGRTALEGEIRRRELQIEMCIEPPVEEPHGNLVTIRTFTNVADALLAKTVLDSAEIECFLFDENIIRMDWLYSNLIGGVKLCVRADDEAAAAEFLSQKSPDEFPVEGVGDYEQPRCPRCGSADLSFGKDGKRLAYATIALGVPLPVKRGGWKCDSCGYSWQDTEGPQEDDSTKPGS